MPGIHFDYTVNDSPFYASADKIVRRVSDMSKVIDNVGRNVSFAPLLSNLDKLMKDFALEADVVDSVKGKLSSALSSISNSSDSAEKKQQKFKEAVVDAFSTISASIDSELGASKTVLQNFQKEYDDVITKLNNTTVNVADPETLKGKLSGITSGFEERANPETTTVGYTDDYGNSADKIVNVDSAVRALREKALEDVRSINEELNAIIGNISDGSVEQMQSAVNSLKPLEDKIYNLYNAAEEKKQSGGWGSQEWEEGTESIYVYQRALEQLQAVRKTLNENISNNAEADALREQAAELETLIADEQVAVDRLGATKTAIEETINATREVGQGETSGSVAASTPQVYMSQEDYENVKQMREEVASLQEQISQFDGSDADLTALKEKLSDTNDQLREAEMAAIETAAAYGDKLGTEASAVSEHLYEMNAAVDEQRDKVDELTEEYNKAVEALNALDGSDDTDARQKAINEYEQVAQSLHQARAELANLEVEQHEANNAWIETTAEMQRHDSVLVKLLGGEEKFKEITSNLPGPLGEAINGLTGMTGAAKAFIATPLGAILAALILAWEALNSWFERSEEGQKALAQITGYLSGVMETLKDVVATVGEIIYKAFTNPKQAMQDFGNFLWSQVVNRFKALGLITESVGSIMKNLFEGNWSGVVQSAKDMANAWAQLGTGIEKPITKVVNALDTLNKKAKESANIAVEEKELQREEAKTKKLVAEYDNRAKQLEAKGKRRTAAEEKELKNLYKKISDAELSIVNKKIDLQKRSMDNGKYDTIEDQNKLDELYAQREKLLGKEAAKQERLRTQAANKAKQDAQKQAAIDAKTLQLDLKEREERTKQAERTADAVAEAKIAAEQNAAVRERMEQDRQHQLNLRQIDDQAEEYRKKNYEAMKARWEATNKDKTKSWADTATAKDVAANGYANIALTDEQEQELAARRRQREAEYSRILLQRYKDEAQAMRDYLKEYGSYEQQRLAIAEEYTEKIKNAKTEGERLQLQKQQEQAQANLSLAQMTGGIDWRAVFGGVENMTTQMMQTLTEQLRAWQQSPDYQNADAGTKQQVAQMLADMRKFLGSDMSITFKTLGDDINNFNRAAALYKEAQEKEKPFVEAYEHARDLENAAINKLDEMLRKYANGDEDVTEKDIEKQKETVAVLGGKRQEAADEMQQYSKATADAKDEMEAFGQKVNTTSDELKNFVSDASASLTKAGTWQGVEGFDGLKSSVGGLDNLKGALDLAIGENKISGSFAEGLSGAFDSVLGQNSFMGSMLGGIGEGVMGIVGIVAQIPKLILQLVGAVKNFVTGILDAITELLRLEWISDLIDSILSAVANVIDAILDLPESIAHLIGSLAESIGGFLDSVIGRIASVFGIEGGPADWLGFSSNHDEMIAIQEEANEELERISKKVDKISERIADEYGGKAVLSTIQLNQLLQSEQEQIYRGLMAAGDDDYGGGHSQWYHNNKNYFKAASDEIADWLLSEYGLDWRNTEHFGDGAEQGFFNYLRTLPVEVSSKILKDMSADVSMQEIWNNITDELSYDGGVMAGWIDKWADLYNDIEEAQKTLYEKLTQTTADKVFDDFMASVNDFVNGSADAFEKVGDNWQEMVNKMTISNVIGQRMRDSIDKWYTNMSEQLKANEAEYSSGEISYDEYLRKKKEITDMAGRGYQDLLDEAKASAQRLKDIGIVSETDESEDGASSGGFRGMSQESSDVLNGRFASLQITGESINQTSQQMLANLVTMATIAQANGNTFSELRNLAIMRNSYLEDISKYSKKMYEEFTTRLNNIVDNTKNL